MGKSLFNLSSDGGIHRGKQQARRIAGLGLLNDQVGDRIGREAAEMPRRCILVFLACRAVARSQPLDRKPRVVLQELNEMLADHAGRAKDAYFDSWLHSCLTIF